MSPHALSVKDAAEHVGFSRATIRQAIRATDPDSFPPPLPAKKDRRGHYHVKVTDLEAWFESLEDA